MRKLLAIIGTLFVVMGLAGALGTYFGAIYTDNTYKQQMECIATTDTDTSCFFATDYAGAQEDFTMFQLQMMLSVGGMVTGGALIAGACAIGNRAKTRTPNGPYVGPPPA